MENNNQEPYLNDETYSSNKSSENQSHGIEIESNSNGTTKKLKLDLEIDASAKDLGSNPYVKWIHLARTLDAWRPFPRMFIVLYLYMIYRVIEWYIALPDPSMEQSALISVVVGAGAGWFGLYVGSGSKPPKE